MLHNKEPHNLKALQQYTFILMHLCVGSWVDLGWAQLESSASGYKSLRVNVFSIQCLLSGTSERAGT